MAEEETEPEASVEEIVPEEEQPEPTAAPSPEVRFYRDFSSRYAEYGDTVTLSYTVKNNGSLPIEGIIVSDQLLGEIGRVERLEPGERKVLSARIQMSETCVSEPNIVYECEGERYSEGRSGESIYLANVELRVELDADKTNVSPGEVVTLRLKLINDGSVNLYGLRAEEPVLGEMGSLVNSLAPGEEYAVTRTVQMKSTGTFQFKVSGSSDTGSVLSVQSNEMSVLVTPVAAQIRLTLSAEADKIRLEEPGEVSFSLKVVNECALELRNVRLSEETRGEIRNLMFVPSGEMPAITQVYEVQESGTYRFQAQVTDSVGDELTVYSEPIEITVLETTPEPTDVQPTATSSVQPEETTIPVLDGASYRMEENPATFEKLMLGTSLLLLSVLFIWYMVAKFKRNSARRRKARQRRKQKKNRRASAKK